MYHYKTLQIQENNKIKIYLSLSKIVDKDRIKASKRKAKV